MSEAPSDPLVSATESDTFTAAQQIADRQFFEDRIEPTQRSVYSELGRGGGDVVARAVAAWKQERRVELEALRTTTTREFILAAIAQAQAHQTVAQQHARAELLTYQAEADAKVTAANEALALVRVALAAANQRVEESEARNDLTQQQLNRAQSELRLEQQRAQNAERRVVELNDVLDEKAQERERERVRAEAAVQELRAALADEKTRAQVQFQEMKTAQVAAENRVQETQAAWHADRLAFDTERQDWVAKLKRADERIADVIQQHEHEKRIALGLQNRVDGLQRELEMLTAARKTSETEQDRLRRELQTTQATLSALNVDLARLGGENTALLAALQAMRAPTPKPSNKTL
jgi:ribosomal protein S1